MDALSNGVERHEGASNPVVLYRPIDGLDAAEGGAIERHFSVYRQRAQVPPCSLVVGRYSVLPFYGELEDDLHVLGSRLVNSHREHQYVADLGNWVGDLEGLTPRTWSRVEDLPGTGGPYVVKGETNSRKDMWQTHMYAEDKAAAVRVALRLQEDSLISTQRLYVREYVPLETLLVGLNGAPVTREHRFFVLDGQVLCGGYYWSSHVGDLELRGVPVPDPAEVPRAWLDEVVRRVAPNVRFFVVDVAKAQSGDWVVVELNDGQMSGLSECDPDELYGNLKAKLSPLNDAAPELSDEGAEQIREAITRPGAGYRGSRQLSSDSGSGGDPR